VLNWRAVVQTAEKEHHRLIKQRGEYQSTCTQSAVLFDVASKEANKLSSQIDLAFSVEFNLAIQVISF